MSNPLVLATQEFLKRRKSEVTNDGQPFDTYLSLSGGMYNIQFYILFLILVLKNDIYLLLLYQVSIPW
jgi:hypothetical protein